MIREKGLNRVVVAACTPRTHEPVFRDTLREGGINQYYYEMANIREHCSWVHSKEKEEATQKAKDLIRMSVARTHLLEPLDEFDLPVNKAARGGRGRHCRDDGVPSAWPGRDSRFICLKRTRIWAAWPAGCTPRWMAWMSRGI